jgi:hypothetical protein
MFEIIRNSIDYVSFMSSFQSLLILYLIVASLKSMGARSSVVCCGTMLQAGAAP